MVHFDIPVLTRKVLELENLMQESGFWDDAKKAAQVTQDAKKIKDKVSAYEGMKTRLEDSESLIDMCIESDDGSMEDDIKNEVRSLKSDIENFRIKVLLSGEYDFNNAIVTLHSGAGGTDAQDWTMMLLRMYTRWAEKKGFKVETIDMLPGDEAGLKSADLKISGEYAYGYLKSEMGIHRLVRISPFNANGKRQTSFAAVEILPELTQSQDIEIRPEDIRVDTYRASGAGGQYVNKTESAIRITHIATGVVVQCQNERSQHSNRETAMAMLKAKLVQIKEKQHKDKIDDIAGELMDNSWGSQIRSYVFQPYTLVKDHRTGAETGNVNAVLDGDIDLFINEYLKHEK